MRVLWFTNILMPGMLGSRNRAHATSGSWMVALAERLSALQGVDLFVACAAPGISNSAIMGENGIRYFVISQGTNWRARYRLGMPDGGEHDLKACVNLVEEISPDLVHVHGTERFYGLMGARKLISTPMVLSVQGLVHECAKYRNYFGASQLKDALSSWRPMELLRTMGHIYRYGQFRRRVKQELEVIKGNVCFMGRTLWDRSHVHALNPSADYFQVSELLRPSFHGKKWGLASCKRHRIIFTNATALRRDTETLLHAVALLKTDFPDITLGLAGGVEQRPYGNCLKRIIELLNLRDSVEFLGPLNEEQMTNELSRSHVFAITSLIENSPNSLCEAQLVGLPCVASYVGGIPSLIDERKTGLLFPVGDAPVLAAKIREIFMDDELAAHLGSEARCAALLRHDPELVTHQVLQAYEAVIGSWGASMLPAHRAA